jgi:hypothetical protein
VSLAPHRRGRRKGRAARAPGSPGSCPRRSLVGVRAVSHREVESRLRLTRLDPAGIGKISARLTARSTTISGFGFGPEERLRRKERTGTPHLALARRNTDASSISRGGALQTTNRDVGPLHVRCSTRPVPLGGCRARGRDRRWVSSKPQGELEVLWTSRASPAGRVSGPVLRLARIASGS